MGGNKSFSVSNNIPGKNNASGRKRLPNFSRKYLDRFTRLIDTFKDYTGRGGLFLKVKDTEDGIETSAFISDKNYIHYQIIEDLVWSVTHGLNKYPKIDIIDLNNRKIDGEIIYIDLNNLTVNFDVALSGKVICN
jgi:hypothetical protein